MDNTSALIIADYFLPALLHQPLWRACSSAYTNSLDVAVEPRHIDFVGTLYLMAVRVDTAALVEEHLAVARLPARHEEHEVVACGEGCNVGHAVGHLAADGVETLERGPLMDMLLYVGDDLVESVKRLRGLRIEVNVAQEVEPLHVVDLLHDNGPALRLSHQPEHLGVSALAEYYDLRIGVEVILPLDAPLQGEHHGTRGVNDFDVVLACEGVGLRRFAVGAQQHLHPV